MDRSPDGSRLKRSTVARLCTRDTPLTRFSFFGDFLKVIQKLRVEQRAVGMRDHQNNGFR